MWSIGQLAEPLALAQPWMWHPEFVIAILKARMIYLFAAIHVIVCLFLIVVVLLQSGQAADLAGAFGGMGSQTVFGPRGSATVLSRATTWAAIIFMFTSLSLAILGTRRSSATAGSVLD